MKIIAISNQKGGVGKTTTSVNLGAALAERGQRVLLVDLDPQGNLSTHVGVDIYQIEKSMYDVLTGSTALSDVLQPTASKNLSCAPSNIDLSGAEVEMVAAVGRETILKEALARLEPESFDFVLIDCPPSLGLLSINALAAADEIIVPMQTEFFALQGMSKLMEVVELVRARINPKLKIGGIIACRMDTRTRLATEVIDDIHRHFPDLLFATRIRQNVKLAEAPSFGQTVIEYDAESNGAVDYRELAAEFLGEPAREPAIAASGVDEEGTEADGPEDAAPRAERPDAGAPPAEGSPDTEEPTGPTGPTGTETAGGASPVRAAADTAGAP